MELDNLDELVFDDPGEVTEVAKGKLGNHTSAFVQGAILQMLRQRGAPFRPPLRAVQNEIYKAVYASTPEDRIFYIECSRRLGKTYLLLVIAIIFCNSRPGLWVRYAGPTYRQLEDMIKPVFYNLWKYIAEPYRPKSTDRYFVFPNMSRISFGAADVPDSLRGSEADLIIIDEAGFVKNLKYLIDEILDPMLQGKPFMKEGFHGKMLIGTTPAREADHYSNELSIIKETEGNYIRRDIFTRDDMPQEELQAIIKKHGGVNSPSFMREYRALRVIDETLTVVPEYHEFEERTIIEDFSDTRPDLYDSYTVGDIGFSRDLSAVLLGYYNYKEATLYILDEIVGYGIRSRDLCLRICEKEKENQLENNLFVRSLETREVHIDAINSYDFLEMNVPRSHDHHTQSTGYFSQVKTPPGAFIARIHKARQGLFEGRVKIYSRCKNLRGHLKAATWGAKHSLKRSEKYGHFDALMAFVYMVDAVNELKNPYPEYYGVSRETHDFRRQKQEEKIYIPSHYSTNSNIQLSNQLNKISSNLFDDLGH